VQKRISGAVYCLTAKTKGVVLMVVLFGASLLYGDGMITPAISGGWGQGATIDRLSFVSSEKSCLSKVAP
jgi:hypothetical protein